MVTFCPATLNECLPPIRYMLIDNRKVKLSERSPMCPLRSWKCWIDVCSTANLKKKKTLNKKIQC
uniref:Uncharacterized protein n=1 Tax=Anguilla anguilla TaxID=7936 RepID=A0A0E9X8D4_ANGAN